MQHETDGNRTATRDFNSEKISRNLRNRSDEVARNEQRTNSKEPE